MRHAHLKSLSRHPSETERTTRKLLRPPRVPPGANSILPVVPRAHFDRSNIDLWLVALIILPKGRNVGTKMFGCKPAPLHPTPRLPSPSCQATETKCWIGELPKCEIQLVAVACFLTEFPGLPAACQSIRCQAVWPTKHRRGQRQAELGRAGPTLRCPTRRDPAKKRGGMVATPHSASPPDDDGTPR